MLKRSNALAVVLALAAGGSLAHARPVEYSITDLGSLPASNICNCFFATAISENAAVAGFYFGPANERRGFVWRNGVISDVGGATGQTHVALGVNDAGTTVGFGDALAFRAQDSVATDLPSLGGPFADARDINNADVVVGQGMLPNQHQHAVMWVNDEPIDLGTLGGPISQGLGVNDAGQVVGWAWNEQNQQRAFVWTEKDGMVELAAPENATIAQAVEINSLGHAVGTAVFSAPGAGSFIRAFVWIDGVPADIGDTGDPNIFAISPGGINDSGVIVGLVSFADETGRPFIRRDGAFMDPNDLIDPDKGWTIDSVADVNNAGQIAASGIHIDGRRHALLLTPVDQCAADFNADGFVNSQDFFAFLEAFFEGDAAADFNADAAINSADFFAFLSSFFNGC